MLKWLTVAVSVWFLLAPESARRTGIAIHRPFRMEPSVLAVNLGLRSLELPQRQLELLLAVVGFLSLLLE